MRTLLLTLVLLAVTPLIAEVVRPAPDFSWNAAAGQARSLKSLRGQPVVLLIADSARNRRFRKQISYLEELYRIFASKEVVFAAALESEKALLKSDIPFVLADNGPGVAQAYALEGRFNIVIIGPDGNIDLQSGDVATAERVRDILVSSFQRQAAARKR